MRQFETLSKHPSPLLLQSSVLKRGAYFWELAVYETILHEGIRFDVATWNVSKPHFLATLLQFEEFLPQVH